jgi:hypothetical protein
LRCELTEVGEALVAQRQLAADAVEPGVRRAAAGQAQDQVAWQFEGLAGPARDRFEFA